MKGKKNKTHLFIYGVSTRIFIGLVGNLMLAELIAFISLPFTNLKSLFRQHSKIKTIVFGLIVLLFAQIISDFINQSDSNDFLRGWATIIFTIFSTIFLVIHLSRDTSKIVYYFFALFIVRLFFGEGELDLSITETNTNYFKIRFMGFLNPFIILLSYYLFNRQKKMTACLVFVLYGLLCITMDARANSIIFILAGLLLYLKARQIKLSRAKASFYGAFIAVFLYISYVFYVDQVLYNSFGGYNAKTQLAQIENPYNPFELLMQGRPEVLVLVKAGLDKPIFGHGSWAKDPGGKYAKLAASLSESPFISDKNFIHAHSILMGYWAYAGVFGVLSITFVFFKLFSMLSKIYKLNLQIPSLPILLALSFSMFWDFFFSPIGHMRIDFPIFAALIIVEYSKYSLLINNRKYIK